MMTIFFLKTMLKNLFIVVMTFSGCFVLMNSPLLALQSGGVEVGDLEPDLELEANCEGGLKAWTPSLTTLDLEDSLQTTTIRIKVTNHLPLAQGIRFSADQAFIGPATIIINIENIVNPGESKIIYVPIQGFISKLTFSGQPRVITFISHTDQIMEGGKITITGPGQ